MNGDTRSAAALGRTGRRQSEFSGYEVADDQLRCGDADEEQDADQRGVAQIRRDATAVRHHQPDRHEQDFSRSPLVGHNYSRET
ncbi:hypothetical protein [Halorubrum coriense]|uniref:hypothetical protein n=1 Tax=Halorubrum coriense TaxID=64713 RepID=UPI001268CC53|nr:hypothetical protein [Halorubrum coriense]